MDQELHWNHLLLSLTSKSTKRKKRTRLEKLEFIKLHPKCVYCGSINDLVLDHIYPISFGGIDEKENITVACVKCNSTKHDYPIDTFLQVLIDKREYCFNKTLTYTYNLRQLRKGKPCHFQHTENSLISKIIQQKIYHSYLTKIIFSITNHKYLIFK